MDFIRRFGYFLFGLAIGLVFLAFFLRKKSDETGVEFCYLPNCRVLKDIRSKPMEYAPGVAQLLKGRTLDSLHITHMLREGNIDFGKSDTRTTPCKTYLIQAPVDGKEAHFTIKNCPNKSILTTVDL
ncbi:MAG: DUF4258 domain-containing protein [Flavobacteriaceae bacterium]